MAQPNMEQCLAALTQIMVNTNRPASARAKIEKDIRFLAVFTGEKGTLPSFVSSVQRTLLNYPEEERPAVYGVIFDTKIQGTAKNLLYNNPPTDWNQCLERLRKHFRPSRDEMSITKDIGFLKILITLLLTTTGTNGQRLDVQNVNAGNGFVIIKDQNLNIITNFTKILHHINLTTWTDNLDIIEQNIDKLDFKNEYPTIIHNFRTLSEEIENLLVHQHQRKRRGLFNIVGKGLKYLTGTMDYEDEEEIKQSLDINKENNKNVINGLNEQIKINDNFNEITNNISKQINKQQHDIKEQFENLGNAINQEHIKTKKMQHAFQINYDIDLLRAQVKKVKENLMLSQLGILNTGLLTPKEIKSFNITLNKIPNIKSSAIIHEDQIIFILLIPNYSEEIIYKITVEPIPNKNYLEIVISNNSFITNGKLIYYYTENELKLKDLKITNDTCLSNLLKENMECEFKENKNVEIKQIANNVIVTKNIMQTEILHNCHNFKVTIVGNNILRFENCKIIINNVKYENFVYNDNFIVPNFKNISIKKIVMNYTSEKLHFKQIENRKAIEEIKRKNITHISMNIGTFLITFIILSIILILNFKNKSNIKVNINSNDSPEQNLKGGGVTSETSPYTINPLFPTRPFA